jgi:RNA polymerase sigma factor (sigma-70 family)
MMLLPDDAELLRRYADDRAEDAFATLVRRHLTLVYSVALRQVGGDAHLAQDVAQRVFTDLARKARALSSHAVLGGWLYRATHFAATDAVRAERRRRAREQEAHIMEETAIDPTASADWDKVRPVLDAAISELREADRDAVVLRFFEARSFAEIGAVLRLKEDAARMRVERALEKLREGLARRGLKSTAAALGLALANQTGASVPVGLAATVTGAAVATRVFWLTRIAKLQIGLAAGVVVLGLGVFTAQRRMNEGLHAEIAAFRQRSDAIAKVRAENDTLARVAAEVEMLRGDDAEFARLRDEAAALREEFERRPEPAVAKAAVVAGAASVAGKVNRPGDFAMSRDRSMTLIELLTRAGGLTATARRDAVLVTRRQPDRRVLNVISVNADAEASTFVIEPDDRVYVMEKK